jgi:hypothetical protein
VKLFRGDHGRVLIFFRPLKHKTGNILPEEGIGGLLDEFGTSDQPIIAPDND